MKLLTLTLLLLSSLLFAQKDDFSIIVHKPLNATLFDITEDYDRTISAVGVSKEYKRSSNSSHTYNDAFSYLASVSSKFGSQMHLLKVGNKADILLSKVAHLSKFNEAVALVKTPSNGYFIGGYTMDGSLLVLKLDADANPIFTKSFGTKNYDRMNNLILMSDGGVLAVGSSITSRESSDDIFNSGLGNNDIFLTRFSKDGHKLWSKKYGTMHDDRGIDAVEARDGSILVISSTSYQQNRDVNIMRITENGDKIWLKHYTQKKSEKSTMIPKKIIRLKDNNFLIALTQYNGMQKKHIRLIKFDLYQNILLEKEIHTTYSSVINDIKEFSNGNFIVVGDVEDTYNTDGLAMILNSNLALLNQEHYGGENYDVFHAVVILHNSQVAVAGVHTEESSQETNMWILKLNNDASMVKLSTPQSSFYDALCKLFEKEIEDKKISIDKDLTIHFLGEALLFKVAKYQLSKEQEAFMKHFSSKLLPFLYKHKEKIQTLEMNGHTSQEWERANLQKRYLNNEKLSLRRSYETLRTIFSTQDKNIQKWLTTILKGSGYSYSKRLQTPHASRRVTFKIILY